MTHLGNLWQKQALSALCLLWMIWPGLAGCTTPAMPALAPIAGTNILDVTNTDADLVPRDCNPR